MLKKEPEVKYKMLKRIIILLSVLTTALAVSGCGDEVSDTASTAESSNMDSSEYTYIAVSNKYPGIIENAESWSVNNDSDRTVKEVFVNVGDDVKAGDELFSYDTEKAESDLEQARIDLEKMSSELANMNKTLTTLNTAYSKATKTEDKQSYELQIQDQQLEIKQKEYDIKSKQLTISKLEATLNDSVVVSQIDGVVSSINNSASGSSSGDDSFITVMKEGSIRVRGTVNEMYVSSLNEGDSVNIYSRIDNELTWTGRISSIDTENPVKNDSGGYSEDTTSNYYFYVDVDETEGLMIGQHVYIEDTSETSESVYGSVDLDELYQDELYGEVSEEEEGAG